jgi:hypothetical protein
MTDKPHIEIEGLWLSRSARLPHGGAAPIASFPFTYTASALFGQPHPLPRWAAQSR